jgi:hypothetical protein
MTVLGMDDVYLIAYGRKIIDHTNTSFSQLLG